MEDDVLIFSDDGKTLVKVFAKMENDDYEEVTVRLVWCTDKTIADLEGREQILSHHIAEAIGCRNLHRGVWAEHRI